MTVESPEAFDLDSIHSMSPQMATEALAAMQARNAANPVDKTTRDGIRTMSPQQAGEALAEVEMSRRPLGADGKPIPAPPLFTGIVSSHERQALQIEDAISHLETNGFPARGTPVGDELHAMLDGTFAVTPEVEKAVRAKHAQCIADRDWSRRLMEGDQLVTREFHTMNAILAAVEVQRPSRFGAF